MLQNPYYEWAKKQAEKQKTSGDSNGAMATTTSADATGTEKTTTSPLPQDAQASEPTDAKGTVDDRTVTGIEEQLNKEGETADSVTKTATEGTKEFYTISTKSGKIFYLIIDNSKSQDNVYFLTEVSEKDLMNFTPVSYTHLDVYKRQDRLLADFLDVDDSINVNIHIQSIDQSSAIKMIKSKISDLDKMKIEEQKRAVRSGYDMDVLPSDLVTYGEEAKNLLEDLQSRNERMFLVTVLVMNTAKKRQKLDNNIFQVQGIAQKYNCSLKQLDYQQEAALMSCIPLGVNRIEIQRGLTTSSTAIFVPFTTQELFQEGEALYYGLNALSNNMIMVDRKRLKNPNGLILGTPGSGKSFSAKREITNCFLITEDDIIVCDPEAEYSALVQAQMCIRDSMRTM